MAFNAKRNDVALFTAGTWVSLMGAEFKLARAGNPEYEKALEESGYRKKEEPSAKQRALYTAVATGVLKDWRDVVDNDGEPIPYGVENAVEVLMENPDLVARILNEANDLSNYRREDHASQGKRQPRSSAGSTSGKAKAEA
ncbi:hypothetical protein [Halomonas sp. B23F22_10]|uniref:hypothetical protein n=1 Tax=Halomonas sp. B23F22_10 TaxID=3459515 RepID=UPI00373F4407